MQRLLNYVIDYYNKNNMHGFEFVNEGPATYPSFETVQLSKVDGGYAASFCNLSIESSEPYLVLEDLGHALQQLDLCDGFIDGDDQGKDELGAGLRWLIDHCGYDPEELRDYFNRDQEENDS